jgi:hypothetical protein
VPSFAGNISIGGMLSAKTGIAIAGSTLTGAIVDSGTLPGSRHGITIDSASKITSTKTVIAITGSTFTGGISNVGAIIGKTGIVITSTVSTFSDAISNSGTISGSGGTAINVSGANDAIAMNQSAGLISGAVKLSANADALNISGGSIAGNIVGSGHNGTINFALGSGTFTYANNFTGINQVNVNSGTAVLEGVNSATNITIGRAGALAPSISGSILGSNLTDNGTFSILGLSTGASIASLSGTGSVTLSGNIH